MRLRSFLTGVLVGGIIGGSTVLLTTPESGKKMRYNLKQETAEWKGLIKNVQLRAFDVKSEVLQLADEGKRAFKLVQKEMLPALAQWKQQSQPTVDRIMKEVNSIQKHVEQLEQSLR